MEQPDQSQVNTTAPTPTFWTEAEDWHTAGQPFRIIRNLPAGYLPDAETVAERRTTVLSTPSHPLDTLRKTLCLEPRGHPDMYGGFITPPDDSGAHFGAILWHKDGFSTACGHGTIALGYWAVSKGLVEVPKCDGTVDVVIDVPSGRVSAAVAIRDGKPRYADFKNVMSYVLSEEVSVQITSYKGAANVRFVYAGAICISVAASQFGLAVEPSNVRKFIDLGREIKAGASANRNKRDPDPISGIAGVIFFEEQEKNTGDPEEHIRQKNVTVFADGQIDRSPCGSGTCARLAVLLAEGRIGAGSGKLLHQSIIGTFFEGKIVLQKDDVKGFPSCIPMVRGCANLVGRSSFFIDPEDPVFPGFFLK